MPELSEAHKGQDKHQGMGTHTSLPAKATATSESAPAAAAKALLLVGEHLGLCGLDLHRTGHLMSVFADDW